METLFKLFPLFAIVVLIMVSIGILILRIVRPKYKRYWLITAFGFLISWGLLFLSVAQIPEVIQLGKWQSTIFSPVSPVLLLDGFTWIYALSLATLGLAVIFSEVIQSGEVDWISWVSSLILIALGIIAVLAGDEVTLLLAWAAIDLFELILWMSLVTSSSIREKIVLVFSLRAIGLMIMFFGAGNQLYYLVAISLRLGVLPLHLPGMDVFNIRRGLGTIVRLVPPIASLGFITRISLIGVLPENENLLLVICLVTATYAGVQWFLAKNELDGRPHWVLGLSALSLAAAIRGQPVASLVFGLNMLLEGGLILIYSVRSRYLNPLIYLAAICLTALPFTPGWDAARLFAAPLSAWMIIFLVPQALFLSGYIRHSLRPGEQMNEVLPIVWIIYPLALLFLVLLHYGLAFLGWSNLLQMGTGYTYKTGRNIIEFWAGILILGLILVGYVLKRVSRIADLVRFLVEKFLSLFRYGYSFLISIYRGISNLVAVLSAVLEGEGGILWTLLLLAFLLAFFAQEG